MGGVSICPCFCLSPIDELCRQPGCWQGTEAPTWGSGSCGVATGDKRARSSEAHNGCPSSLPEPRATYPQLSHVLCTGQHTASRTRRGSKFIAATSAAADVVPAVVTLRAVALSPGLMSQSRWFRVLGTVACRGRGATWGVPSRRGGRSWDRTPPTAPR